MPLGYITLSSEHRVRQITDVADNASTNGT